MNVHVYSGGPEFERSDYAIVVGGQECLLHNLRRAGHVDQPFLLETVTVEGLVVWSRTVMRTYLKQLGFDGATECRMAWIAQQPAIAVFWAGGSLLYAFAFDPNPSAPRRFLAREELDIIAQQFHRKVEDVSNAIVAKVPIVLAA